MRENQKQRNARNSFHHVVVPYRFVVAHDTSPIISLVSHFDLCFYYSIARKDRLTRDLGQ